VLAIFYCSFHQRSAIFRPSFSQFEATSPWPRLFELALMPGVAIRIFDHRLKILQLASVIHAVYVEKNPRLTAGVLQSRLIVRRRRGNSI
jgi:hypothetical protein